MIINERNNIAKNPIICLFCKDFEGFVPFSEFIFNLFTSFFAIHYYKIGEYACKSTKIISEKGTITSKYLRNMQIIEYFAILPVS